MFLTSEEDGLWYCANLSDATPLFEPVLNYPFRQPERVYFNPFNPAEIWVTSFGNGLRVGRTECLHTGDINEDDVLTAGDAQSAFQIALALWTPTYQQACAADCTGDGTVTSGDAQAIFLAALGLGTCTHDVTG
jgi:hypothetical protein